MTMPRRFIDQSISKLQVGDEGRVPSWALEVDLELQCWLMDTTCYRSSIGGATLWIKKEHNGIHVWIQSGQGWIPKRPSADKPLLAVAEIHEWKEP